MLKFEIVSSRTVESDDEKKYVAYMLQVRQDSCGVNDADPANVERRYTQFLDLYNGLKKDFPAILNNVSFPRKVIYAISLKLNVFKQKVIKYYSIINTLVVFVWFFFAILRI